MDGLVLVIGNKNYSSWSLRAWLALKQLDVPFSEVRIPLDTHTWQREIGRHSPSRKVPVLKNGECAVWESLAIVRVRVRAVRRGARLATIGRIPRSRPAR